MPLAGAENVVIHRASVVRLRRDHLLPFGLAALVCGISLLHYSTNIQSILLHEIFKRLYYVPIVVAAMAYGVRGGLATSVFASVLYLPHVAFDWSAWPALEVEQYGEVLLFNIVAAVAGVLADRLRAERNRYRQAATELQDAYGHLKVRTEERLRVDRLVTIGRLAAGLAHEIRNPLGGLLGCVEILEPEFPPAHPKREFFTIARKEIRRLESVVTEFLEFAEPAPPSSRRVDLDELIHSVSRLARVSLMERNITLDLEAAGRRLSAEVDLEQVQRALLTLLLAGIAGLRDTRVDLRLSDTTKSPAIILTIHGVDPMLPIGEEIFDPFPPNGRAPGLALATARRLVENQGGALRAERVPGALQFVIDVPPADATPAAAAMRGAHSRGAVPRTA